MVPDPFADLIEPFSRRGVDLGLERLQAALAELGHPERRFAAVQVRHFNKVSARPRPLRAATQILAMLDGEVGR